MPRFRIQDIHTLENAPISPFNLRTKLGEMILNSTVVTAKVETVNPETGEYRLVLQGTLDKDETKFE